MKGKRTLTLSELAEYTGSKLVGDPNHVICDVADLASATSQDVSFLANPRYTNALHRSSAGAIFVSPEFQWNPGHNFLLHENPSQAFQNAVEVFHLSSAVHSAFTAIHPTAVVHDSCVLGENVTIGPFVVIDQGVSIGAGTYVGPHCSIGPDTKIGEGCVLYPRVTIRERCTLGNRVILQPGVVVGSCGFGYTTDKQGKHTKLNQVGTVTLEDDVEIGANSTIDRARFKDTRIGRGTKIDNLVQIGHGVVVGEDNIIVAQTGIAGSTTTGKRVIMGGQVAVAGHLTLGNDVVLTARTGVSKSLSQAGRYGGAPAMPLNEYNRNSVKLRQIENSEEGMKLEVKKLQERLRALEEKLCK